METKEYSQVIKRIKLYAISVARDSSLTPVEKLHLFRDISVWAENIAERILVSNELEQMIVPTNINQ